MTDAELHYFVHSVDGARYGAWYRVISSEHFEVISVGMLEVAEYAGFSPENSARSVLENFVRQQRGMGVVVPSLDEENDDEHPIDTPRTQAGEAHRAGNGRTR